jgi:hypothetical protein
MAKTGSPTKYKEEYSKLAYKLALLGSTDKDLSNVFEVSEKTIDNWKNLYPDFLQSLKRGKDEADSKVVMSLFNRANGFHKEETEEIMYKGEVVELKRKKYYPPDVTACIYWLKNRQRDKWGDKKDDLVTATIPDIKIIYEPSKDDKGV